MAKPLLQTKLFAPPVRPRFVSRERLIDRLDAALPRRGADRAGDRAGFARKLTLVSAPAGFGKTTLLGEWIARCGIPVAWFSPTSEDNDLVVFLGYLIAALQQIDTRLGRTAEMALRAPQPPPARSIVASLVNEVVELNAPLLLVLDDYQVIELPSIHEGIAFLLDHMPPQMHLVLATREDPPLPLAKLRAAGQLTEIRAAALRFTVDESALFLHETMGLELAAADVRALEKRTEGWIAGLQLAAVSMREEPAETVRGFIRAFAGTHRYVADYLVEEVLKRQPMDRRDFLLKTSILDRMTAPLCEAVVQQGAGQATLEELNRVNLFILPLDREGQWHRYHHLFAELLRNELRASQPHLVPSLHRRASEWFEQNGFVAEAVVHAVAAQDHQHAARVVEGAAMGMLERSQLAQLKTLVDALPDELVRARPWLCVYHAWALRLSGEGLGAVESRLEDAERALDRPRESTQGEQSVGQKLSEDDRSRLRGHIAALRAYQALYREEIHRVIQLTRQALESRLEGDFVRSSIALAQGWAYRFSGDLGAAEKAFGRARAIGLSSGNHYLAVAAACRAAHGQVLAGRLRQAARNYGEALEMATVTDGRRLPVAGYACVYLGNIHREWNDLNTAERYLTEGIDLCRQVGFVMDEVVGWVGLARVRQARGDLVAAHDAAREAERLSRRMPSYMYVRRWVEDCLVHLWLAAGDTDAAGHWADQSGLRTDEEVSFRRELERIILARVLVAEGVAQAKEASLFQALELLGRLLEAAEGSGWMGKAIEILTLRAVALQGQGRTGRALAALRRALAMAEPEGYVRTFVDEGPSMARLLSVAMARGAASQYAGKLLDAFGVGQREATMLSGVQLGSPALVDGLTSREYEVLRLLTTQLSGPEIAEDLHISRNTLKTHMKRIYSKLNVHSRYEAVVRARDLGLLKDL